jgi:hypothetical protein
METIAVMASQQLPPPINPRQMDILRVATAMAWSDGQLEPDEVRLILDWFANLFAKSDAEQRSLKQSLREYLGQNLPLEEIVPNFRTFEERKQVLKLAYQVITVSRRKPGEPKVNLDEAAAYQRLLRLLDLPDDAVMDIEAEVIPFEDRSTGIINSLAASLHKLIKG